MDPYWRQAGFFGNPFDFFFQSRFCEIKYPVSLLNSPEFGDVCMDIIIKEVRDSNIPFALRGVWNQEQFFSFYLGEIFVNGNTSVWKDVGRGKCQ